MISLTSDLTDSKGVHARGFLFFDANCEHCRKIAHWIAPILNRRGLAVAPLQDPRVGALLGLPPHELLREMRLLLSDNRQYSGADAVVALAQQIWWALPVVWISRLPGGLTFLHRAYRAAALRRHCAAVTCEIQHAAPRA